MTYPITITRDAIVALDPCKDGLALFDEHYPDGVLVVADVQAHMALYSGPLAKHVGWAETGGLLPRVCAQVGDCSTLTGGHHATLTGGYRSTLTGGNDSTLTGGDRSTLTGGYRSTLTGGHRSTLTGGHHATLTGGHHATLTGSHRSTLTGGHRSTLTWRYYDGSRFRLHTVYTGEDGIKQDTPYIGRFADGVFTVSEVTA
jgi:hypothetical protein